MANFVVSGILPEDLSYDQRKRFLHEARSYYWDSPHLFKCGNDQVIRRCIPEEEQQSILKACHNAEYGGHHSGKRTAFKILQSGFYWPILFREAYEWSKKYKRCQKSGSLSWRNEMPQQGVLEIKLFDVWGLDFMGPFPSSFGNAYILLAVEYVSK